MSVERRARRDAAVGVALFGVVDEAAGFADPARGGGLGRHGLEGRGSRAEPLPSAHVKRPTTGERLRQTGAPTPPRASASVIVVRDGAGGLEVLLVQRNPATALHGRLLGLSRRRGRRRRGPSRGGGARARRGGGHRRRRAAARSCPTAAGSRPRGSRSASTRTSSSPPRRTAPRRASTARSASTCAGSPRPPPSRPTGATSSRSSSPPSPICRS